jgi:hypothetical protein
MSKGTLALVRPPDTFLYPLGRPSERAHTRTFFDDVAAHPDPVPRRSWRSPPTERSQRLNRRPRLNRSPLDLAFLIWVPALNGEGR